MVYLAHKSDLKVLFFLFVLIPAPTLLRLYDPVRFPWWFIFLSLYTSFATGTLAHNINHSEVFKGAGSRIVNRALECWVSIWYGFPIFAWIPTHNANHHKKNNRHGDATITWRNSRINNLKTAFSYPFVSAYYQDPLIKEYITNARPDVFATICAQYATVFVAQASILYYTFTTYDFLYGLQLWAMAVLIPMLMLPTYFMMFINYCQHVGCDAWSEYNHSRNFCHPIENFFTFNAGYHTVHHDNASLHWSILKDEHERRGLHQKIDKRLLEPSLFLWWFKIFALGCVLGIKSCDLEQVGRPAWEGPQGSAPDSSQH